MASVSIDIVGMSQVEQAKRIAHAVSVARTQRMPLIGAAVTIVGGTATLLWRPTSEPAEPYTVEVAELLEHARSTLWLESVEDVTEAHIVEVLTLEVEDDG